MGSWNGVNLDEVRLTSGRLTLRPFAATDAETVYAAASTDPWMREFLPIPDPYTRADATQFVTEIGPQGRREGTGVGCAIVETATGALVGSIDVRLPILNRPDCEIGYSVYPNGRGHGYAAEATNRLAQWAFEQELARVFIRCSVRNIASVKTALAAGFGYEGLRRGDCCARTVSTDGAGFARLATDSGEPVPPFLPALPAGGLTDGILALRVTLPEDADGTFEEFDDELSRRWEFDDKPIERAVSTAKVQQAQLHWLVGPIGRLTMVDVASGRYAGSMQLRPGPPQIASIGYGVHPAFRGRGYTTRGLHLLSAWAFEQADFTRLELGAKVANVASQKSALNAGFIADAIFQARLRNADGTFSDEASFALVRPRLTD